MMTRSNIIPIFIPHLGCPNDCVFCNQRKISGVTEFSYEKFEEKLSFFIKLFKNSDKRIELAFYGGSFTAIDRDLQFKLLKRALEEKNKGNIDKIRLSTRPDAINAEIIDYLKAFSVDIIELGVQSMDEEVLVLSKRGHDVKSVSQAVSLIKEGGFTLGLQQMVGLPGDNEFKSLRTSYDIISLRPDFVRIYPTLIIKNTELEEMFRDGKYLPLSLEEAINIICKLIMLYEYNKINIARVGLQSTKDLQLGKDVVAGPIHDSFRELCESEKLFKVISINGFELGNSIELKSSNRNRSLLVGHKGINKQKLCDFFKTDVLKFYGNSNLSEGVLIIRDDKREYILYIQDEIRKIVEGWDNALKKY